MTAKLVASVREKSLSPVLIDDLSRPPFVGKAHADNGGAAPVGLLKECTSNYTPQTGKQ